MKLIINIPEDMFEWFKNGEIIDGYDKAALKQVFENGTPLDTIKTEIADIYCGQYCENPPTADAVREMVLDILDSIDTESEDKE